MRYGRRSKRGRGFKGDKVMLDMSAVFEKKNMPWWFMDLVREQTEKRGIDLRVEPIGSEPRAHTTIGGVSINEKCETTVPGLYATGAVAGGVYGHARPEGYTSMITVVFGQRAGRYAAEAAGATGAVSADSTQVQASIADAADTIDNAATVKPSDIKRKIKAATRRYAWVIKDEEGLTNGLSRLRQIRAETGQAQVAEWLRLGASARGTQLAPVGGIALHRLTWNARRVGERSSATIIQRPTTSTGSRIFCIGRSMANWCSTTKRA